MRVMKPIMPRVTLMSNCLDRAMRFKRSKASPTFITTQKPSNVYKCLGPYSEDIPSTSTYHYDKFPTLSEELLYPHQDTPVFNSLDSLEHYSDITQRDYSKLNEIEWAKTQLVIIYNIWLKISAVKMQKHQAHGSIFMDAVVELLKVMKKAGIAIESDTFEVLIETCGYCSLKEYAKVLFKSKNLARNEKF